MNIGYKISRHPCNPYPQGSLDAAAFDRFTSIPALAERCVAAYARIGGDHMLSTNERGELAIARRALAFTA